MREMIPKEHPGACRECGASPTPHIPAYIGNSITAWLNDRFYAKQSAPIFFERIYKLATLVEPFLLKTLHMLSGSRTLQDPAAAPTYRASVLWEEAERRGIQMEQLVLFGKPTDYYRACINNRWLYFDALPIPPSNRNSGWMDDKLLFKQFLQKHGISAAPGVSTASYKDGESEWKRFQGPVVVKPRIGSRARHTATYVSSREDFERAYRSAQKLGKFVIFESHLHGYLCRATLIDGALVGFLKKSAPEVVGDGERTIEELVKEKNATKPNRVWDVVLGNEHKEHLARQGYLFTSIVSKGTRVVLSASTGRQVGGTTYEMPDSIHPKLRDILERVTRLLEVPVVAFDLIMEDPQKDPEEQRWGILEANTVPFIDLHYHPLYGESSNVAGALWDLWQTKTPV